MVLHLLIECCSTRRDVIVKTCIGGEAEVDYSFARWKLDKQIDYLWGKFMNKEGFVKLIDCVSFCTEWPGTVQGLVFERLPETLWQFHMRPDDRTGMPLEQVKELARQLLKALTLMHEEGVVHGGRETTL